MDGVIGTILLFAGNFAPRGWALCHGQLISIVENQALFSILGTTYGGDGRTTFSLPDLRGRVPVSAGAGPGLADRRLGQKIGSETNTITAGNLPAGLGQVKVSEEPPSLADPNGAVLAAGNFYAPASTATGLLGGVGSGGGQNAALNNMQPTLALNYVICMQGTYPSRS